MTAKDLVLDFLKKNGIEPEETEFGLRFFLDKWSFLLWHDPDDPLFYRLTLPGVFDVTDENFAEAIMTCNAINLQFKVVKAVLYDFGGEEEENASNVWICFEQVLDNTPEVCDLVPRSVESMVEAANVFLNMMTDEED